MVRTTKYWSHTEKPANETKAEEKTIEKFRAEGNQTSARQLLCTRILEISNKKQDFQHALQSILFNNDLRNRIKASIIRCTKVPARRRKRQRHIAAGLLTNQSRDNSIKEIEHKMHIEIQVALNFVISYLYNKLPRRRVNLFGEELERALKEKFVGHWYPDRPVKGSAFRCLRVGMPIDPVLEQAAHESGIDLHDIRENLPEELSVWIDPGEVSYRIGEKGVVKMLYVEESSDENLDREVTRSFNPEAQCFKPIEAVSTSLGNLVVSPANSSSTSPFGTSPSPSFKSTSPTNAFLHAGSKSVMPLTFTTATFAQTKFGSTKLKTNCKRSNRMSPTEFSNYIKQRAILQQQQQPLANLAPSFGPQSPNSPQPPQRPRSLSPSRQEEHQFLFMGGGTQQQQQQQHLRGLFDNGYNGDLFGTANKYPAASAVTTATSTNGSMSSMADTAAPFLTAAAMGINDSSKSLLDGINFNLNSMPYPNQHLLVAN